MQFLASARLWVTRDFELTPQSTVILITMESIEIRVCLRDKLSTNVLVSLPENSTGRDAMLASGLIARDGTPYRCFDSMDNVIDDVSISSLKSDVFVGVPKEIQAVMIEETTCQGRVGRGRLMDGTLVHIPGLKEGQFAWIVISGRHGTNNSKANGYSVRMEGQPYQKGDLIQIKPRPEADRVRIFNPQTCKWDLRLNLQIPDDINQSDYEGIMWTVKVTNTRPLTAMLDSNLTWVPDNQPDLARAARRKFKMRPASHA